MRIVCVIVLLVLGCCRAQNEEKNDNNTSLIQDLRKKLIHNNYDYIQSSFEVTTKRTFYKKVVYGDVQNDPNSRTHVFVPDSMKAKHKTAISNLFDDYAERDEVSNTTVATTIKGNTTASVKLKVIKVKDLLPSRRGGEVFRHVIQQEDANGVVLVSLDGHPLPQFRLPNDRRQYMQEESRSRRVHNTKKINGAQKKSQVHDRDVSLPTDDDKKDVPLLPSQRQHPENKTRFDIDSPTDARRRHEKKQQLKSEGLKPEDKANFKKCQDVLKNCFEIVIEDDSVSPSKDLREDKNDDYEYNSSVYKLRSVPDQKDAEINGTSTLRRVRSGGGDRLKQGSQKHNKQLKKVLVINKKMLSNLNFKSDVEIDGHRASNLNNRKRVNPAPVRDMIYNEKLIARNRQRKNNKFFIEDSYELSEESDLYTLDTSISKHFILGRPKEIQNRRVKTKLNSARHKVRELKRELDKKQQHGS